VRDSDPDKFKNKVLAVVSWRWRAAAGDALSAQPAPDGRARVFAGWVKQVFDTGFARIRAIRGRPTKLLNQ
jgi:hypothetical protein